EHRPAGVLRLPRPQTQTLPIEHVAESLAVVLDRLVLDEDPVRRMRLAPHGPVLAPLLAALALQQRPRRPAGPGHLRVAGQRPPPEPAPPRTRAQRRRTHDDRLRIRPRALRRAERRHVLLVEAHLRLVQDDQVGGEATDALLAARADDQPLLR